jgi:hypothetical protein
MTPYYEDAHAVLYLGDALEVLGALAPVDGSAFAFTDPPYNVGMDYGRQVDDTKSPEVFRAWTGLWIALLRRLAPVMAVYTPAKHTLDFWSALGPNFRQIVLTWTPSGPVRRGIINQHATLLTNATFPGNKANGIRDVWENLPSKRMGYAFHEVDYGHPGSTSEGITRKAVGTLGATAGTVIDPFAGTGTTLVIAKERGMRAIGIEQSERWAEAAARRLENTTPGMGFANVPMLFDC